MLKGKQQGKQDAYVTNLLISLLMRFPEIMSINFDMPREKCKFSFMLQGNVSKEDYAFFKSNLGDSLDAYFEITGSEVAVKSRLVRSGKMNMVEITCRTDSLCLEVIQLVTALMDIAFASIMLRDLDVIEAVKDEEMMRQEEIIEYLLNHTAGTKKENLIAFREAGKVYVYDK